MSEIDQEDYQQLTEEWNRVSRVIGYALKKSMEDGVQTTLSQDIMALLKKMEGKAIDAAKQCIQEVVRRNANAELAEFRRIAGLQVRDATEPGIEIAFLSGPLSQTPVAEGDEKVPETRPQNDPNKRKRLEPDTTGARKKIAHNGKATITRLSKMKVGDTVWFTGSVPGTVGTSCEIALCCRPKYHPRMTPGSIQFSIGGDYHQVVVGKPGTRHKCPRGGRQTRKWDAEIKPFYGCKWQEANDGILCEITALSH